jgi:hypothetical protein
MSKAAAGPGARVLAIAAQEPAIVRRSKSRRWIIVFRRSFIKAAPQIKLLPYRPHSLASIAISHEQLLLSHRYFNRRLRCGSSSVINSAPKADTMPRHDSNTREVILNFTPSARRDSSPL